MRSMQLWRSAALVALLAALSPIGAARAQNPGATLTLEEAQQIAQRNNPDLAQARSARGTAGAALRSAYGGLLPTADVSFSSQFRKGGSTPINGVQFETGDIRQSSYWLGLNYRLSMSSILAPSAQKANLNAAEADLDASEENIRSMVAQQYFAALKAEAQATLQDSLVISGEAQLELARARSAVGAGTQLDIARAQVTLGQSRVAALQAHNAAAVEKLKLFAAMGVAQPGDVRLTSNYAVTAPDFQLDNLLDQARRQNPTLNALRARDHYSDLQVSQARSAYLPTLQLSTGWGGYTYENTNADFLVQSAQAGVAGQRASCFTTDSLRTGAGLPSRGIDCNAIAFTPADQQALLAANDQFPFDFQKQPFSLSASLSVPLFDGFSREQRVQEAQASRTNASARVRAQELQLTQTVTAAYLTLETARQTVALQEQNSAAAREELRLAEERYRVGASTFLDVTEARASFERAESDRITAIYDFHSAFAALESAVGRPLR